MKTLLHRARGFLPWSSRHAPGGRRRSDGCRFRTLRCEPLEQRRLLAAAGAEGDDASGLGYLPPQQHLFRQDGFLSPATKGSPLAVAMEYLTGHAADLELDVADLGGMVVTDQYVTQDTGATHIYLRQTCHGLEILNAEINVNVTSDGRVVNVGSSFVPGLGRLKVDAPEPKLDADEALQALSSYFGWPLDGSPTKVYSTDTLKRETCLSPSGVSLEEIPAELAYVPVPDGGVALAWSLVVSTIDAAHCYHAAVDACSGKPLLINDWVDRASYKVFALPLEDPDDGPRTLEVDPHDAAASPYGWHDTNGAAGAEFHDTRGNNALVQEDHDNDNGTVGHRADGGSALRFDFPLDLAQDPLNYTDAAITNAFYWTNVLHDVHFQYGFDEAAGNFQVTNYSGAGLAGDAVEVDAQEGGRTNNASFRTPPDGQIPRMRLNFYTDTTPRRDSDLDNGIIIHEYGHGVSARLTGGPSNANSLWATQSDAMAEGWSDWWALMFTQQPGDGQLDAYPHGSYASGDHGGSRRFEYSFDMDVCPLTLRDYNGPWTNRECHNAGEIWCAALWDINWMLINAHGYDPDLYEGTGGNNLALQLVMDGLKIQLANPSFLFARDCILVADLLRTGGQNQAAIWAAFARRGMGFSADDGGANSTSVSPAFDMPPDINTTIEGSVWNDLDEDGRRDDGEPGLPRRTVFLDMNHNGVHDDLVNPRVFTSNVTTPVPNPGAGWVTQTVDEMIGPIADVNVTLAIAHPQAQDLTARLVSPSGTSVDLFQHVGPPIATGGFAGTILDDEVTISITSGIPPYTGSYRPEGNLSDFDGEDPNGVWMLQVVDGLSNEFSGAIAGWSLTIEGDDGPEPSARTDAAGDYVFNGLAPGWGAVTYEVVQQLPAGWERTAPAAPGSYTRNIEPGMSVAGLDFGNYWRGAAIRGSVFYDRNQDGVWDHSEPTLPNRTVFLDMNRNGVLDQLVSPQSFTSETPLGLLDGGVVVSSLTVDGMIGPVDDVNVTLSIAHPYPYDLVAWLYGPGGSSTLLFAAPGPSTPTGVGFVETTLDDEATASIADAFPPFTGAFRPLGHLGDLDGEDPNGLWRLAIVDRAMNGFGGLLQDWTLTLSAADGPEPSTQTDGSGRFSFERLGSGPFGCTYRVTEELPPGWQQTHPPRRHSHIVWVEPGQTASENYFGNYSEAEIRGHLWNDLDDDGTAEAGEPALPDWTVYLDMNNNGLRDDLDSRQTFPWTGPWPIPSPGAFPYQLTVDGMIGPIEDVNVTLNIDHAYPFQLSATLIGPAGTRVPLFQQAGPPNVRDEGFIETTLDDEATTPIASAEPPFTGSFRPDGKLGAFDGHDPNGVWTLVVGDAVVDRVGSLLNWSLAITVAEGLEPSTVTDENGAYAFPGLAPDACTYIVREAMLPGWRQTHPGGPTWQTVSLGPGVLAANVDFGNRARRLYWDGGGSGPWDDPARWLDLQGQAAHRIPDRRTGATVKANQGVNVVRVASYQTVDDLMVESGALEVRAHATLRIGEDLRIRPDGQYTSVIARGPTGQGLLDVEEDVDLAGTLDLWAEEPLLDLFSPGTYPFGLWPSHETREILRTGSNISGRFDRVLDWATLGSGAPDPTVTHLGHGVFLTDQGVHRRAVSYTSKSVKVDLFQAAPGDCNGDGEVGGGDIQAILAANLFGKTETQLRDEGRWPAQWPQGDFTGDGLVGGSDIQAILAANLFGRGPYAAEPAADLDAGDAALGGDGGDDAVQIAEKDVFSVRGTVWEDRNPNGVQDPEERGVEDVTVVLYCMTPGEPTRLVTTDAEGRYRFSNLPAGDYQVEFHAPPEYHFTLPNWGSDDRIDSDADLDTGMTEVFTLPPPGPQRSWDAGLVSEDTIILGDRVWNDLNGDGIQEPGEPGIAGVSISLWGNSYTMVRSTQTNELGQYAFVDVEPGKYFLRFQIPGGHSFTSLDAAADDTVDSDAQPGTGDTATFSLAAGQQDLTWDAGVLTRDYGDAPDPGYRTLRANQGAFHAVQTGFFLGDGIDADPDGQPNREALGDDEDDAGDDEDGVAFVKALVRGHEAMIEVTASDHGVLDAWIDFDQDGSWAEPHDEIVSSRSLARGVNVLIFQVPGSAAQGLTYARFRLSHSGELTAYGDGGAGEVEDYPVLIEDLDFGDLPDTPDGPFWYRVTAPDPQPWHRFGGESTLDIYGNWLVVGARGDGEGVYGEGAAYVYRWNGSDWVWQQKLIGSDTARDDMFGNEVSIWGDHLLVGATGNRGGSVYHTGAAYAYCWDGSQWQEVQKLTPSASHSYEARFGCHVSVWEDWAVIGARTDVALDQEGIGAAYVFHWNGTRWEKIQRLTVPGSERFGTTVEVFGDWMLVGDPLDAELAYEAGAVYAFRRDSGVWTLQQKLMASDGVAGQHFSGRYFHAISMFEDRCVIGAYWADPFGYYGEGAAYVFALDGGTWVEQQKVQPPFSEEYNFGQAVALWEDRLLMSAWAKGIVCDYRFDGTQWTMSEVLTHPGEAEWGNHLGTVVALFGNRAAVGAPLAKHGGCRSAGEVYVIHSVPDPSDYPTLFVNDGARHRVDPDMYLGARVDIEADGEVDDRALGDDLLAYDDEEGVVLPFGQLSIGEAAHVRVTASAPGYLNAWVDFDDDGDWDDDGEQIFAAQPLVAGLNRLQFPVPLWTATDGEVGGQVAARFRFSSQAELGYSGRAPDGEVEDYFLPVEPPPPRDFGDAPQDTYPTLLGDGGPWHILDAGGPILGERIDAERDAQADPHATGDDLSGDRDEDGVRFRTPLVPTQRAVIEVYASAEARFYGWIDFNGDGDWEDVVDGVSEQIFDGYSMPAGGRQLFFAVPASAVPGTTFARFRLSTAGGLSFDGPAPDGEVEDYEVTIELPRGLISGRHIFYEWSIFDVSNPDPELGNDDAIAPDKQALLPGQTATFANYTSYSRGIEGIMVDIGALPGTPTAADFEFKTGNDNNPADWEPVTTLPEITVRPGAGRHQFDRVTLIWPPGTIWNTWLQVTVLATANTGLTEPDVFYFGSALGESGDSETDARVNAVDILMARNNPRSLTDPAPIDFPYDYNRDGRINATDLLIPRAHQTDFLSALKLITVPAGKGAAGVASSTVRLETGKLDVDDDLTALGSLPPDDALLETMAARQLAGSSSQLKWLSELDLASTSRQTSQEDPPRDAASLLDTRYSRR